MEKYVTSLELSKRLKELGVKQESKFYWCHNADYPNDNEEWLLYSVDDWNGTIKGLGFKETYSAYLTDELAEMLPVNFMINKMFDYYITAGVGLDSVGYIDEKSKSLPEALGLMLEYLKVNNLI